MLPGILATTSHYLRSSSVLVNDVNFRFTTYSALIGEPSVGKSPALAVFEKAAYEIERVSVIGADRSAICNAGTIEAVVEILKIQGNNQINFLLILEKIIIPTYILSYKNV